MRIVIIASGSRGDVEPYVALGKGLQAAGHVVRLVTHRTLNRWSRCTGWILARRRQRAGRRGKHGGADENGNFLAILAQIGKEAQRGALALTREPGGLPGHGTVVAGIGGVFVGIAIAEKLGMPLLHTYYIPFTPTAPIRPSSCPNRRRSSARCPTARRTRWPGR